MSERCGTFVRLLSVRKTLVAGTVSGWWVVHVVTGGQAALGFVALALVVAYRIFAEWQFRRTLLDLIKLAKPGTMIDLAGGPGGPETHINILPVTQPPARGQSTELVDEL